MEKYIGIDIGGTKCAVIVGEYENGGIKIVSREAFSTDVNENPYNIIEKFAEIISTEKDFRAIGISCGGPLDSKTGVVLCPPNLPMWVNVPITDIYPSVSVCLFFCRMMQTPAHLPSGSSAQARAAKI